MVGFQLGETLFQCGQLSRHLRAIGTSNLGGLDHDGVNLTHRPKPPKVNPLGVNGYAAETVTNELHNRGPCVPRARIKVGESHLHQRKRPNRGESWSNRNPLQTTKSEAPVSAAIADQSEDKPNSVRATKTPLTAKENTMF